MLEKQHPEIKEREQREGGDEQKARNAPCCGYPDSGVPQNQGGIGTQVLG